MTARPDARDEGASAVEYALIVSAIAAVIVSVVIAFGSVVHTSYTNSCVTLGGSTSQCDK
jgi:pilus assembly protein Flp/PilA